MKNQNEATLSVVSSYKGSFSAPAQEEAILELDTSDSSHAEDFGKTALFQKKNGTWGLAQLVNGKLFNGKCLSLRTKQKQDFLVCESSHTGQGEQFQTYEKLVIADLKMSTQKLTSFVDTTGACSSDYTSIDKSNFKLTQPAQDLVVDFEMKRGTRQKDKTGATDCDHDPKNLKKRSFHLVWKNDGTTNLTPTPDTTKTLKEIETLFSEM